MSTHYRLNTSFECLIALNHALECLRYKHDAMLLVVSAGMMQFDVDLL